MHLVSVFGAGNPSPWVGVINNKEDFDKLFSVYSNWKLSFSYEEVSKSDRYKGTITFDTFLCHVYFKSIEYGELITTYYV